MPWIVYRYILADLLRVIVLTGAVLVTVIAFGATIKPLTSDMLLDARQTLKYLALAIVPMMQFALPFAAGFGATLALHRLTADNEVLALSAAGMSYRRIVLPVLALGALLSLLMVALTQSIIPRFWSLIEATIATDATRLFQASITRGEPFQAAGDMQIYADDIVVQENPEGPEGGGAGGGGGGPQTRMLLLRVAAAELDRQRRITTHVTASQGVVDVYRREGRTFLRLVLTDTVASDAAGGLFSFGRIEPRPIVLASARSDNPKAMTRAELLALRRDPDSFRQVIQARTALLEDLGEIEARSAIDAALRASGEVVLQGPSLGPDEEPRRYATHADRLQREADGSRRARLVTTDGRRIEIVQLEGAQPIRRFSAADVTLAPAGATRGAAAGGGGSTGASGGRPAFDLLLGNHEVTDLRAGSGGGSVTLREQLTVPTLTLVAAADAEDLASLTSTALVARARDARAGDELRGRIRKLNDEIDDLQREITSRLHQRYALSLTAFLLLALGGTLAMWLRGSLPLTIYVWAFVPSIANLILISAGEQLLRDGRAEGLYVMWSGNGLLLALLLLVFMKLSKN